jgi:hypothetical protein
MGGADTRRVKTQSYAHFADGFSWMPHDKFTSFQDPRYQQFNQEHRYAPGSIPPSGNANQELRAYPRDLLPEIIYQKESLRKFFFDE